MHVCKNNYNSLILLGFKHWHDEHPGEDITITITFIIKLHSSVTASL